MSTIYGSDNMGVVATTDTKSAPHVGYDATLDYSAFSAMSITHTGTTDGATANTTDWLHYKVTCVGGKTYTGVILPQKTAPVKWGFNTSLIIKIELWGTAPNSTSDASNDICATVNGMVSQ